MRVIRDIFTKFLPAVFCDRRRDVFWNIHKHRPGPSRLGDTERLADRVRQLSHILYDKAVFCYWHCNARDINLLKTVFSKKGHSYIAGDCHDRD